MPHDPIADLLREADRATGPAPTAPADLADRVRRLERRQHKLRVVGSSIAALLVLSVGTVALVSSLSGEAAVRDANLAAVTDDASSEAPPEMTDETTPDVARPEADIAQLRAEIIATLALTKELADQQAQQRRLIELRRTLSQPDPVEQVRQQVDKAAFIIVYQADRMYRELNLSESAVDSYKQAIELFPDSRWAKVARDRLAEIEKAKGDQL